MNVVHFQRHPEPGNHSIERLFADVRAAMPSHLRPVVSVCRYPSRGAARRIFNTLQATLRQGDVNHITGDVHYLAYFLRRERTLLTVCDCVTLHRLSGSRRRVFRALWYDIPMRRTKLVSVISESTRQDLLRSVPSADPDAIRVVPACVSPMFGPSPSPGRHGRPVILHIGTTPHKNLERLARALEGLACHLRVVGRLTPDQEQWLRRHGIEFSTRHGLSDGEMIAEYANCDLVAFVSTYEGFGLPIVEANAVGRPVVTSNVFSMPEVAGEAACIVDPFDVKAIREGINRVLDDSMYRRHLVEAGYDNARRFDATRVAAQYLDLYAELAGR